MEDTGWISPGTMAEEDSGGNRTWSDPDNAKVSDDNYTRSNVISSSPPYNITNYLKATNFGFSIPIGVTINGIEVEIEKKATYGNNAIDNTVKIIKADGTIGTTNKADTATKWGTTDAYASYGLSSDLWGETWTPADINNSNFGVVFAGEGVLGSLWLYVDHIRITVYYTKIEPKTVTAKVAIKQLSVEKTVTAKVRIQRTESKTAQAKARIKGIDVTKTIDSKVRIKHEGVLKTITAKSRIKNIGVTKTVTARVTIKQLSVERTITARVFINADVWWYSRQKFRHPKARVKVDWNLGDGYQDETEYLIWVEIERKLIEPLGGVSVAQADVRLVNVNDRYTPPGQET